MKRILILLGLMAATSLGMQAENRTVTDTVDGKKRVIELQDTVINGQQTTDTLSITTYEGTDSSEADSDDTYRHRHDSSGLQWVGFNFGEDAPETIVALTAIIFVFGLPALLLFIIFYFRYKNRKAKYRLAEQALAAGQQLPPEFFKETKEGESKDLRSRGIKNIFLGIGLFIFLWALTGEFSLGCIGLPIMFTGFGQVTIYYTQPGQDDGKPFIRMERDEKTGYRYMKVGGIELRDQTEKKDTPDAEDTNKPKE